VRRRGQRQFHVVSFTKKEGFVSLFRVRARLSLSPFLLVKMQLLQFSKNSRENILYGVRILSCYRPGCLLPVDDRSTNARR